MNKKGRKGEKKSYNLSMFCLHNFEENYFKCHDASSFKVRGMGKKPII